MPWREIKRRQKVGQSCHSVRRTTVQSPPPPHTRIIQTHIEFKKGHPLARFVIGSREGGCLFDTSLSPKAGMSLPSQPLHHLQQRMDVHSDRKLNVIYPKTWGKAQRTSRQSARFTEHHFVPPGSDQRALITAARRQSENRTVLYF